MSLVIDRATLDCAAEIFKNLGTAIYELQLYTEGHPRFKKAASRIADLIWHFFQENPKSKTLTFTLKRHQAEFRNIPLVTVGSNGERLITALDEFGCKGLQFLPNISVDDLQKLLQTLIIYTRPSHWRPTDPPANKDEASYRFLYVLPEGDSLLFDLPDGDDEKTASGPNALVVPEFRVSESVLHSVVTSYRTLLNNIREGRGCDVDSLRNTTDQVVHLMAGRDLSNVPAPTASYFDEYTFHHSINVALLTARAASLVVNDQEKLNKISMAALLHDVGKSRVPAEILMKPGKLTTKEAENLRTHPLAGAEILLSMPNMDPLCVTVAFGHHLRTPELCYPKTLQSYKVDWITELVAVVDTFETLTAVRPYKEGLSSELAFQALLRMPGMKKRLHLIKLLYESLGPYPVGTFVELSSGVRGVVIASNPQRPLLPKVRILTDDAMIRLSDTVDLDLSINQDGDAKAPAIVRTIVRQTASDDPLSNESRPEPSKILGSDLSDEKTLMEREG